MISVMLNTPQNNANLTEGDVHTLADARSLIVQLKAQLQTELEHKQKQWAQLKFEQTRNAALNLEVARLKNWRFGTSSESMDAAHSGQSDLFDAKLLMALTQEAGAEDRAQADALALAALHTAPRLKQQAKRQPLPSQLERIIHRHEIEPAVCAAGHPLQRIGEEISERLDCVPAQFFVHRHIRGKYCCQACQTVLAADLPAQIIDKGIPAAGLLAQVIIAKHDDHLPLFRQEEIYRRSGAFIARSSMAGWVGQCAAQLVPLVSAMKEHLKSQSVIHADETPVKLLAPGTGKTHQAYVWAYRSSDLETQVLPQGQSPPPSNIGRCVIYEFATSRAGEHARQMLKDWRGTLLTDDYSGYKALFAAGHVKEAGCWAHARRKFHEAHKLNQSEIAAEAVRRIAKLYAIERQVQGFSSQERLQIREAQSRPLLDEFKAWLTAQRMQLADADVTAKAIDYTTRRWAALTLHLEDANLAIDNNAVENAMRPIALGRKNWLFVGSETAGERAACLMSLIESAKLNGHDAWHYLKDILTKLPTWPNSRLHELLPHNWQSPAQTSAPERL